MLIALHGFTEIDTVWLNLLSPAFPDLRCPLLPGHGWKPCPKGTTIASTVADIAASLPSQPVDVLGYSMGGRVAIRFALDFPHLVKRLVLINCNPGIADTNERSDRRLRDEHLAQILEEDGLGPFVAWWQSNPVLKPAKPLPRSMAESLRCMRLNHEPCGLANALRLLGASNDDNNLWARLPELRMPVLLVNGAADKRYSGIMTLMAKDIPHAQVSVIADAGHAVHREQPDALVATVRAFLA